MGCDANSGERKLSMTDDQAEQTVASPRRRGRDVVVGVCGLMVAVALVDMAWRRGTWLTIVLGFVGVGIPLLLLEIDAWKRWLRPQRIPARWPANDPRAQRLVNIDRALTVIWVVSMWVNDKPQHHHFYVAASAVFFGGVAWDLWLSLYIADRKHIPPPRAPYDPPTGWRAGMQRMRSEHWGEHA